jgi:hypothetical protein
MAQNLKLIQGKQINVNLTGSFTGSFTGDGSGLTNISGQSVNTSSFVTTSSFNAFTSSYNTGSFTGSFSGSLFGTASFATISSASQNANTLIGFTAATIDQINVGEPNRGDYAFIVRTQELEQSKHTTINIYNNLNFI